MRALLIHNEYAAKSGEEVEFSFLALGLRTTGVDVHTYTRSSAEIGLLGRPKAFVAGIYNPVAVRKVRALVRELKPDVAIVQNLFPLISPAVLPAIADAGVPIVMRVANYRLMCPNGLFLSHGEICERCVGGKEYWCVIRNCESNPLKSLGYAARTAVARHNRWYADNVSAYVCASQFLRDKLITQAGVDERRVHVIPNNVPRLSTERLERPLASETTLPAQHVRYVAYIGRISTEKGIDILIEVARRCPGIRFRCAGKKSDSYALPDDLPPNLEFVGFLGGEALQSFTQAAEIVIAPSVCYETFGLSVAEAMLEERPVVASRLGVIPEFIDDGQTGILATAGDAPEFARKIAALWDDPENRRSIGTAARESVLRRFRSESYISRFTRVCESAIGSPIRPARQDSATATQSPPSGDLVP